MTASGILNVTQEVVCRIVPLTVCDEQNAIEDQILHHLPERRQTFKFVGQLSPEVDVAAFSNLTTGWMACSAWSISSVVAILK